MKYETVHRDRVATSPNDGRKQLRAKECSDVQDSTEHCTPKQSRILHYSTRWFRKEHDMT